MRLLWISIIPLLAGAGQHAFTDVTSSAGLAGFLNKQGTKGKDYIVESIGGGAAFFDFDGDGWLDILLVRGTDIPTWLKGGEPVCALFRNKHDGTFDEITESAGLTSRGWGMGVTIADYDSDGFDDIFITGYGRNFLYRNTGRGTFVDVTDKAGLGQRGLWSTGAVFFDYNRDGRPDLYVSRYVRFDIREPVPRSAQCQYKGLGVFCGPQGFASDPHSLYRNNGDGTFTDVSAESGIRSVEGPAHGLGVIAFDYDNDGWPDLYVANDSTPNLLWHNLRNGHFREAALESNVALSADGREQASMGVVAGDLRNRGLLDLFVTNFSGQGNQLYRQLPSHDFEDETWSSGIARQSLPYLGWSAHMEDFDGDGWLDLLAINGHVYPEVDGKPVGTTYAQRPLLFRSIQGRTFESFGEKLGPAFQQQYPGRGCAIGDFDNDGDVDILINNIDAAPVLLRNDGVTAGNWLQVELTGASEKNALGARISVRTGDKTQVRVVTSASGYLSASSRRAQFSLGQHTHADEITVAWPDGRQQTLKNIAANQLLRIHAQ